MAFWWILIDISFRIFSFSGNKHRHLKDSLDVFKGMKLNWLMVCVNPDKIIYQPFDELKGISPLIVHKNHHTFWFIVLTVTFKNVSTEERFEKYDDYLFDAKRTIQCDAPFIPFVVQPFLLIQPISIRTWYLANFFFCKCDIKIGPLLFEKHPKIFIRATNQIACSS